MGGGNHDADEARNCKGNKPHDAGAMAKFSFPLSQRKHVSKKAATFGRDDGNNNEKSRSGLLLVHVADEARKAKGVSNKAARFIHDDDDDDDNNDDDNNDERKCAFSVPFLQVFATGFHCSDCRTPVGSGKDAVIRHIKKFHGNTVVGNWTELHTEMLATKELLLKKSNRNEPVATMCSMPEIRLKCRICKCSYQLQHNFNRHIRVSNGRCDGSVSVRTACLKTQCGRFVEVTNLNPNNKASVQPSFNSIKLTIAEYIRDDEDVDTFVAIFTPFVQSNVSFATMVCEKIDLFDAPLAPHEQSLQTLLAMGETWLLNRARYDVSLVPGNYRASLLQFDAQDMGEVSQNLTYNFRHREQTLLPELKKLLVLSGFYRFASTKRLRPSTCIHSSFGSPSVDSSESLLMAL